MSGWFGAGAIQAFVILYLAIFQGPEDDLYRFLLIEQPAWRNLVIIAPFIMSNLIAIYSIFTGKNADS